MRRLAKASLCLALLTVGRPARADDTENFIAAVNVYKAGNLPDAAKQFYELANGPKGATQQQSEYYLAESFLQMKLLESAFYMYGQIVKSGPSHPKYADALVGLVKVDEQLKDDALIPSILNKEYDQAAGVMSSKDFPQDVLLKINYLVGRVTYEKGKYDDAVAFLDTVTFESSYYARAQYLKGVVLARRSREKDAQAQAQVAFQKVLDLKTDKVKYLDQADVHDLALIGAARVAYGAGEYEKSVQFYESVPRFSRYWDQELFENGWARFQNDDLGGALGSLQALHAPQFEGSFQPESWVLTATTYFFSCLYDETKFALKSYEDQYQPMSAQIRPLLEGEHDLEFFANLLNDDQKDKLPKAVRNFLFANSRLQGFLNFLHQLDVEKGQIDAVPGWRTSPMGAELQQAIDQQRQVLVQVTGKFVKDRLQGIVSDIAGFQGQVEIIRFETLKKEKEVLESNTNVAERLKQQKLYHPANPAENWDYWSFQGEFWIDEIGYYQYTLKSGCVKDKNE